MKKIAIILGYIIAVITAALGLDSSIQVAIVAAATFLFVVAFVAWASGSAVLALSTVLFLTILFPVLVLLFIGSPVYASWVETLGAIVNASLEHGVVSGFEWFVPLSAACAGVVLARHMRSNKPLQATREDARA